MFREMRRKRQLLPTEESVEILQKMTSGTLAVIGDEGYPYTVPMSFTYQNNKIYFHSALAGHKVDAIRKESKVSFCVTEKDDIIPCKFTTYYRSVIVFGKARILDTEEERMMVTQMLFDKYTPQEGDESRQEEIRKQFRHMCIIELTIEHITGKESIELVRARKKNE